MENQIVQGAAVALVLAGVFLVCAVNRRGYVIAAVGYVLMALAEVFEQKYWGASGFLAVASRMVYLWGKNGGGGGLRFFARRRPVLTSVSTRV